MTTPGKVSRTTATRAAHAPAPTVPVSRTVPQAKKRTGPKPPPPQRKHTHTKQIVPAPRHPAFDETAALHAFEAAYKEFARGQFVEARALFKAMLEKHTGSSDVVARARTYLSISEARVVAELNLPRDADSLYDRGVIELNRGRFVAAQEMFEQALSSESEGAHIHYGLAVARARLGALEMALKSLLRAIDLQPNLRLKAQHDNDLSPLRSDPEFDRLVFTGR